MLQTGVLASSATDLLPEDDWRDMCSVIGKRIEWRFQLHGGEGRESRRYDNRQLTLLPDAAEEVELLGDLSAKSIPTSRDCNIRRIGSLQSTIGFPVAEVICVAVTVSDGLFRLGESAG